jgi:uncharacterized protein (DUF2345 family)
LQSKQGTGGLPPAPPSARAKPTEAAYASVAPPPNPQDAADLQQEDQQAGQAEQEASGDAPQQQGAASATAAPATAASAAPASVSLGQTPAEVRGAMGEPARVANLGAKVIYYYNGMKVVFKNGKVSDVE